MKRIAFITNNITNSAGTERVVVMLANFLSVNGFSVKIHSISTQRGNPFYLLNPNVAIIHHGLMAYTDEPNKIIKIYKKVANTFKISNIFKIIDADVLIGTGKNINLFMAFFVKSRVKVLIGCEHFAYSAPMSAIARFSRKFLYNKLNALVVLTEVDKEYYLSINKNVYCIPNPVSFYPEIASGLKNNIAIAIGRHTEQKGFDILIKLWGNLVAKHPEWTLKIVGAGPLLQQNIILCNKLSLSNNIEFIEPTKDIIDIYVNASIYLMTSRYEAFPMVLLEAMACGLPCISFDCETGPAQIITNDVDGFLIGMNNTKEFEDKLLMLMEEKELRMQMGAIARKKVLQFDIETIGQKWLNLFDNVVIQK